MADRITKICQITKFPLVSLINVSPNDKARTVRIIVPTASGKLSERTADIGLCLARIVYPILISFDFLKNYLGKPASFMGTFYSLLLNVWHGGSEPKAAVMKV